MINFFRKPKPPPEPSVIINVAGLITSSRIDFEIQAIADEATPTVQTFVLAQGVKNVNGKIIPCRLVFPNDAMNFAPEHGQPVTAHLSCMIVSATIIAPQPRKKKT